MSSSDTFRLRIPVNDKRAVFYESHRVNSKPFRHDSRLCVVLESALIGNIVDFKIQKLPEEI